MGLVAFRLLLAPLILLLGLFRVAPGWVFVVLMTAGILSDIFDGIIARRLGVATALLRRMDSQADLLFWTSIFVAASRLHPDIVSRHAPELIALLVSEALCYVVSFIRFRRQTSTHSYLAKTFGVGLFIGMLAILGFGQGGLPVHVMSGIGLLANADVVLIILLLPQWDHDIPSSLHALRRRRAAA
jgi:CDP-diacylglycerol--glycerol-3-phosphate 3-phosphatidyltransferase